MRHQTRRLITASRTACVCFIVAMISACAGEGLKESPEDAIGSVVLATVTSVRTGVAYPLYIYLPESYSRGTAIYPAIYATDGDAPFPPASRFINFKRILERRGVDAILVGIGGTKRRSKDFVLPGAVAYHEVLTQEVVPYVESHFRADPKRRILSGISLGGAFVVTSLFLEAPSTPYFSCYISADGSFHLPTFVEQEQKFSSTIGAKSIPATLILARAATSDTAQQQQFSGGTGGASTWAIANFSRSLSEATNSTEVDSLYRRMMTRHYADLDLVEMSYSTSHVGTDNPSFEDALTRIFQ